MNFQVLQIPSLKAILPFKCKYHKNSFHHWFCNKFEGSPRVAKGMCLGLIINAELCMTYQMSVFKTTVKHLGSMNDWFCACKVKPMSASMKIVFFMYKIPWSFSWKLSASFLSYVLRLTYFACWEGFDKLQMILVIYDIQTQNFRKPISTKQKK